MQNNKMRNEKRRTRNMVVLHMQNNKMRNEKRRTRNMVGFAYAKQYILIN